MGSKWVVEVKFIDGTKVNIEVEADNEHDAYMQALPVSYEAREENE